MNAFDDKALAHEQINQTNKAAASMLLGYLLSYRKSTDNPTFAGFIDYFYMQVGHL